MKIFIVRVMFTNDERHWYYYTDHTTRRAGWTLNQQRANYYSSRDEAQAVAKYYKSSTILEVQR